MEGQFEIVVRKNQELNPAQLLLSRSPKLMDALGDDLADSARNDFKTEIGILESSSVLMPVFETFKKENNLNNSKKITLILGKLIYWCKKTNIYIRNCF